MSSSPIPNMPRITTDADALHLLKSDMAKLRDGVLAVIQDEIYKSDLAVGNIRISLKNSPEEDRDELVFRVNVESQPDEAIALWELIGMAISDLRPTLSKRKQHLLDEKIGIFVEW
jgi:hypothetical protein